MEPPLTTWIAAFLLSTGLAHATTAQDIIDQARDANRVDSSIQTLRMVLVSKSGSERVREMEIRARRDGEVLKSLARFTKPSDVAGTQLLLIDQPDQVDEQLLYMPALKRTNRISGKARKGSFMGSDFSYEDLEFSDISGATHTLVSEDDTTWVIDTKPAEDSSYGRIRNHVTKADHVSRKVEFFDDEDAPLKVLEVKKTSVDNGITLPVESVMTSIKKGTSTRLEIIENKLGVSLEELPDETFTKEYMER
jgi:hypothetical protein